MALGKRESRYGRRAVARLEEKVFELETKLKQVEQMQLMPPCDLVSFQREVRDDFMIAQRIITYKALRVRWDGKHYRRIGSRDLFVKKAIESYELAHVRGVAGYFENVEKQALCQLAEALWADIPSTNYVGKL